MRGGRRQLDLLLAWLDAGRRGDRDGLLALLAPGASWQGVRPEWRCATPQEVADMWLDRAPELDDVTGLDLRAGDDGPVLHLRAPSLAQLDPALAGGVRIAFALDAGGRIASLTDHPAVPAGVPEAPVRDGVLQGRGWFVLNVADAPWVDGPFGAYTTFQGEHRFERLGINVGVLQPGQPACLYHREGDQEDFLVLRGEALLIVEEEVRRLRTWDLFHCPDWTAHVLVGAGDGPCTVLAVGTRTGGGVVYPRSEVAIAHSAGARETTPDGATAYGEVRDEPARFDPAWLPR